VPKGTPRITHRGSRGNSSEEKNWGGSLLIRRNYWRKKEEREERCSRGNKGVKKGVKSFAGEGFRRRERIFIAQHIYLRDELVKKEVWERKRHKRGFVRGEGGVEPVVSKPNKEKGGSRKTDYILHLFYLTRGGEAYGGEKEATLSKSKSRRMAGPMDGCIKVRI